MDELLDRITAETGLDRSTAAAAVGIVMAFLARTAPPAILAPLREAFPGVTEPPAADAGRPAPSAGLGGGVMALAGELGEAGLSMQQMQDFARTFFAAGREKAGEDAMGALVGAVPGLGSFV